MFLVLDSDFSGEHGKIKPQWLVVSGQWSAGTRYEERGFGSRWHESSDGKVETHMWGRTSVPPGGAKLRSGFADKNVRATRSGCPKSLVWPFPHPARGFGRLQESFVLCP